MARWRCEPGVTWTTFDDSPDWVVFNPAAATIHLVSDAVHALWAFVEGHQTATTEELTRALAENVTIGDGAAQPSELTSSVTAALAFMDEAGLLRALGD